MLNTRSIKLLSISVYCSQFLFPFDSSPAEVRVQTGRTRSEEFPGSLLVRIPGVTAGAPVLSLVGVQPTSPAAQPAYTAGLGGPTPLTLQFPGLSRLLLEKQKGRFQVGSHLQPRKQRFPPTAVSSVFMTQGAPKLWRAQACLAQSRCGLGRAAVSGHGGLPGRSGCPVLHSSRLRLTSWD